MKKGQKQAEKRRGEAVLTEYDGWRLRALRARRRGVLEGCERSTSVVKTRGQHFGGPHGARIRGSGLEIEGKPIEIEEKTMKSHEIWPEIDPQRA